MADKLQHSPINCIIFMLLLAMLVSLFVSRIGLSVSMIAFVIVCFYHGPIKEQLTSFRSSLILWSMSLLCIAPLISGIWSADQQQWLNIIRIKAPLLFLPLAFAAPFSFSKPMWDLLQKAFIVICLAGACWTLIIYLQDPHTINETYLKAKTVTTPLLNDHVRFSWLVAIAVILSVSLWLENKTLKRRTAFVFLGIALFLVVFLHFIAVRTGLLCLYMAGIISLCWQLFNRHYPAKKKRNILVAFISCIIALPLLAYQFFPSFQNRIKYLVYDKSYIDKGQYLAGSTDGVRLISITAGWDVMNSHPFSGTGFGDIRSTVDEWYNKNYPPMIASDHILPSNEWLVYGTGLGWAGFILFTAIMLLPFFIRLNKRLLWVLLHSSVCCSFLFDIGLEVQFGVFIYALVVLCAWKCFEKNLSAEYAIDSPSGEKS